jgi:hypothetical protein
LVTSLRVFFLLVAFLIVPASVSLSAQQGRADEPRNEDEWIVSQTSSASGMTAVDGIEVWTPDQSRVLYDRSFDAPLRYTVWRVDGYLIVEGPFRQYYYGVDYVPYMP